LRDALQIFCVIGDRDFLIAMVAADMQSLLGPFYGAIAVPSVTRCHCCRCSCGHRCAGGVRQWWRATVATPGEWQCKIRTGGVRRLAVANGPKIFQMLFVPQLIEAMQNIAAAVMASKQVKIVVDVV